MPELSNPKRERFCQEFIIDLNGYKAAIRAKYSKKTARVQASQLLTKLNIQERIAELQKKRSERTAITQERVLEELAMIGFSDIRNYLTIDKLTGAIQAKGFEDIPKDESRVLKSIKEDRVIKEDADGRKTTVYDKVKFELWDKPRVLELMARHLGLVSESVKHSGKVKHVHSLSLIDLKKSLKEYKKHGN